MTDWGMKQEIYPDWIREITKMYSTEKKYA